MLIGEGDTALGFQVHVDNSITPINRWWYCDNALNLAQQVTASKTSTSGGVYLGGTGSVNKLMTMRRDLTLAQTQELRYAASAASGRYTKVGRLVTLTCLITPSSVTSSSTYFDITGLPFGSGSVTNANAVGTAMSQYTLPKESQLVTIANGTAVLRLYESDTGRCAQHSDISTSSDIYVTIT